MTADPTPHIPKTPSKPTPRADGASPRAKNATLSKCILIRHPFVDFHQESCVFVIFISFFDGIKYFFYIIFLKYQISATEY